MLMLNPSQPLIFIHEKKCLFLHQLMGRLKFGISEKEPLIILYMDIMVVLQQDAFQHMVIILWLVEAILWWCCGNQIWVKTIWKRSTSLIQIRLKEKKMFPTIGTKIHKLGWAPNKIKINNPKILKKFRFLLRFKRLLIWSQTNWIWLLNH